MKVAAYQAPLLLPGSSARTDLLQQQVRRCEQEDVEILCCPEALLGGLADYAPQPATIAYRQAGLTEALAPLASDRVAVIIGFTELSEDGALYNSAAVFWRGAVCGIYRKLYPAIRRSVYAAGERLGLFNVAGVPCGILICNDSNHPHVARALAAQGAGVLFVPSNNGLPPGKAAVVSATREVDRVTATENNVWIVRADVAGRVDGLTSYGSSAITAPDGALVCAATQFSEDLLIADLPVPRVHLGEGVRHGAAFPVIHLESAVLKPGSPEPRTAPRDALDYDP